MSAQGPTAPATQADIDKLRDLSLGNLDAILAIALTLANAGLIKREDFVKALDSALDVQRARDSDRHPASRYALAKVRDVFAQPVFAGKPN
jgi:hypothetical protein